MRTSWRVLSMASVVSALVLGMASGADGLTNIPAGTTPVKVSAGKTTSGIDAAITSGAAIAGKITAAADGSPLEAVSVRAYTAQGAYVDTAYTGRDGTYRFVGLVPSTAGYYICANAIESFATGGPSTTAYLRRCYGSSALWSGASPPASAHPVPAIAGTTAPDIDIAVSSAGAIAGKVTAANGAGLSLVEAQVYTASGHYVSEEYAAAGRYTVTGLPPGVYKVCFVGGPGLGGPLKVGYLDECWNNVAWSAGTKLPSGAKTVTVTSNHVTSGVDAVLGVAGAISGTVHSASAGHRAVIGSRVEVFRGGTVVASRITQNDGSYRIVGLRPGSYVVCAAHGRWANSTLRHDKGQCWKNVAWALGKPASHATAVAITAGHTRTSINFVLGHSAIGGIAGIVKSSGGKLLSNVVVTASTASGARFSATAKTTTKGAYRLANLPASSKGYLICFDGRTARPNTGSGPTTGFASVCYHQRAWDLAAIPAATARVTVTAAKTHSGINATLGAAGAISGHVRFGATPLTFVTVTVLNSRLQVVTAGETDESGAYTFKGLTPTGYRVCFAGKTALNASIGPTGFRNQCYRSTLWNGS